MSTPLRLLILEDRPADAELMVHELRQAGFDPDWRRVEIEREYVDALDPAPELILADHNLPQLDAPRALALLRQRNLDIPFIVVSGAVGEETAVACLQHGAADYLLKDRLARLGPAVARALREKGLRDATRQAAAALRESETRYRLITQHIHDALVLADLEGRIVFANRRALELSGYGAEEVGQITLPEVLTLEGGREVQARLAALRRGEPAPPILEVEMVRRDGTRRWVEASVTNVMDGDTVVGHLGVVRDISERRRAQEQIRLQAAALEATANAIVITDAGGVIQWVNPAFTRLTGYDADGAIGQTARILKSGVHDAAFYAGLWQAVLAGRTWEGEVVNRRRDGTLYSERQTITPVRDAAGAITHFIAIKQDVTAWKAAAAERQRERDRLHQTEKLAAMGQLLAGVAHELNNPLSVVMGQATLLRHTVPEGPVAVRAEKLAQAAERCARIVKNFLALARQRPPERQAVELNRVVEGAVELLAYQLRVASVQVALELAPDLPELWADPHELHQVVVNLVTNAQDAMHEAPQPRRLSIATRVDPTRTRVWLQVADTGPGISLDVQRRLFEPFFTTKAPGQGTGLGLSLCQGIVESHGGTIAVESQPGHGALFSVELPVRVVRAVAPTGETASPPALGGKAVLVVDDEPEVAAVLAEMLAADGHQVDTAANGLSALARLGARRYDLILSDLRMPELDGPGFYQVLEARFPELVPRVVFLTGDTLGPGIVEFLGRAGRLWLHKPFAPEDVHRVTQQALRAGTGAPASAPPAAAPSPSP